LDENALLRHQTVNSEYKLFAKALLLQVNLSMEEKDKMIAISAEDYMAITAFLIFLVTLTYMIWQLNELNIHTFQKKMLDPISYIIYDIGYRIKTTLEERKGSSDTGIQNEKGRCL
jgi:membrane-anchored protein YejM (alkaline phosphatase superfamily)